MSTSTSEAEAPLGNGAFSEFRSEASEEPVYAASDPAATRKAAYEIGLLVVAIALLGAAVLPRLLEHQPLSFPILYVILGAVLFAFVPGAPVIEPLAHAELTERLTELVAIIPLTGPGLKLDRPFSVRNWSPTWRILEWLAVDELPAALRSAPTYCSSALVEASPDPRSYCSRLSTAGVSRTDPSASNRDP